MSKHPLLATLVISSIFCANFNFVENQIIDEYSGSMNVSYLVSIRYKKNETSSYEHRCTGTIYSSKVILATATCLINLNETHLHVKAGSPYRTQTNGYLYLVEKYILHPDYNMWLSDNDLALLILKFDLSEIMQKQIANITLIDKVPVDDSAATNVGWGQPGVEVNSSYSEVLQSSNVKIVNNSHCQRAYGKFHISQAMLCATGEANTCSSDAGGALVYKNHAVGLKSWGYECGNPILPDVYTNLVYFKEWIHDELAKL